MPFLVTPQSLHIGVIGAGTMGSGIALSALYQAIPVTLYDVDAPTLERAHAYLEKFLTRKGKQAHLQSLTRTQDFSALAACNLVIEAAPEKLELKRDLFAQLDALCPPPAILATNTSTLSVTAIAAACQHPQRVVGMHFFNPAPVLPLVEVVRGAQTDEESLQTALRTAELLQKTPVVARDRPGFIVNRVARPFYGEALRLLGEGAASHEVIDQVMKSAGFRMGPFELMDLIGIDINFAAMRSMWEQTWGEARYRPHPIQRQMVAQGHLGRKTGRGFYTYPSEQATPPAPRRVSRPIRLGFTPGTRGVQDWLRGCGCALQTEPIPWVPAAFLACEDTYTLREMTAQWDAALPPEAPIFIPAATTTLYQAIPWVQHPQRLVGYDNLFAGAGKALTLAKHAGSDPAVLQTAENIVRSMEREPVWVEDTPALVLPRIIAMLANEAAFAVQEGVASPQEIDLAMRLGVNYPKGPLAWAAEIGHARILAVLDHLWNEYREERYRACIWLRKAAARTTDDG